MKAVLLSIQPKWCELIASGIKTIEVRKTKPKLETPFKVYIYCTKPKERLYRVFSKEDYRGYPGYEEMKDDEKVFVKTFCDSDDYLRLPMCSQVIGEFVCDKITDMRDMGGEEFFATSCMTYEDWRNYTDYTNHIILGWHISDLVIYDEPKKLSEFKKINRNCYYSDLGLAIPDCEKCKEPGCVVQKAPQSWCYVEELERA